MVFEFCAIDHFMLSPDEFYLSTPSQGWAKLLWSEVRLCSMFTLDYRVCSQGKWGKIHDAYMLMHSDCNLEVGGVGLTGRIQIVALGRLSDKKNA